MVNVYYKYFNKENPDALEKAIKYCDNFIKELNEKHNTNYITDESYKVFQIMNLYNIFSDNK